MIIKFFFICFELSHDYSTLATKWCCANITSFWCCLCRQNVSIFQGYKLTTGAATGGKILNYTPACVLLCHMHQVPTHTVTMLHQTLYQGVPGTKFQHTSQGSGLRYIHPFAFHCSHKELVLLHYYLFLCLKLLRCSMQFFFISRVIFWIGIWIRLRLFFLV